MRADAPFRLMLVGGPGSAPGRDFVEIVRAAAGAGVDAVQVRDRTLSGRAMADLAALLTEACRGRARIIVNDRVDAARAAGADGVHLPATGLPVGEARKLLGPDRLIGLSVHSPEEAVKARDAGADYVVFGPVYETASKKAFGLPQGAGRLRETVRVSGLPVYAIGGITPARAEEVLAAGAAGAAVMSYIIESPEPEAAARAMIMSLRER